MLDLPFLEFRGFLSYALGFVLGKKKRLCFLLGTYSVKLRAKTHFHYAVGRADVYLSKESPGK